MYAAIRVRGHVNRAPEVESTLVMLNLRKVNHCVLLPENPSVKGMLQKAQHFLTWGEASAEMEKQLKERGPIARLNPPSHGYKSIKKPFPAGALGYRGDKINELLGRMV